MFDRKLEIRMNFKKFKLKTRGKGIDFSLIENATSLGKLIFFTNIIGIFSVIKNGTNDKIRVMSLLKNLKKKFKA